MAKLDEARSILRVIGMPSKQQNDMCCYTFLALLNLSENDPWRRAENQWIRIHDIIKFINQAYGVVYAENSRETIRKVALHNFRNAALIEDNGKATNSPAYRYRITDEALALFRSFETGRWRSELKAFQSLHKSLIELYSSQKQVSKQSVFISGEEYALSSGEHNALQIAILNEFAPRFAPNSECLYIGDSTNRDLVKNEAKLKQLGFEITLHDKMPDVVLYREDTDWIYFIEAVTSVGPMSPKRILEIEEMTQKVSSGIIYVTAFPDFATYKRFAADLAWETEIWLSELPDHMIHMNGDKFLGPRK